MPSIEELLGILAVVFVLWLVLKMARVAVRLILFVVGLSLLVGALYYVFVR